MTDPDRFLSLLEEARLAVAVLSRYRATVPRDRVLGDVDTQNMVLFALYRAVQAGLDLGHHAITERGLPVPSAYREVFRVMGEGGLLDAGLARRLEGWAGFRNVIAHAYGVLDYALVASALYDDLDDLVALVAAMARLVGDGGGATGA